MTVLTRGLVALNGVIAAVVIGRWLFRPSKSPPFRHGLPVFGCAISYFLDPIAFLQKMQQRCGNIFGFNLAGRQIVLLVDNKAISSYYKAPEDVLNADAAFKAFGFRRAKIQEVIPDISKRLLQEKIGLTLTKHFGPTHLGLSLTLCNYLYVITIVRRLESDYSGLAYDNYATLVGLLFLTMFLEQIQKNIAFFVTAFTKSFEERLGEITAGQSYADLFHVVSKVVGEAMLCTYMGAMVDIAEFQERSIKVQNAKRSALGKSIILPSWFTYSSWKKVDVEEKKLVDFIEDSLREPLAKARARAIAEGPEQETTSYLDFVVDFLLEEGALASMDTRQLADTLLTVINGAYTNPAIGSAQALCFIAKDEDIKKRLVQEVQAAREDIHDPKGLNKLPILDAVVRETLRLSAHPMGSMRQVMALEGWPVKDMESGNEFVIPHGWFVGIPHNLKTTDGCVFEKPQEFYPEHFFNPPKEKRSPYAWIPFSGGKHMCPGRNVGMYAMKAAIACWLLRFPNYEIPEALPPLFHGGGSLAKRKRKVQVIPKL